VAALESSVTDDYAVRVPTQCGDVVAAEPLRFEIKPYKAYRSAECDESERLPCPKCIGSISWT
jgi:hypothetical protein